MSRKAMVSKEAEDCWKCFKELNKSGIVAFHRDNVRLHINNWFKERMYGLVK